MKHTIYIAVLVLITSCAPLKTISKTEFKKEEIIDVPNTSKNDLYVKANEWMVSNFGNADSVIEFSDKEEGTILGKYLLQGQVVSTGYGTSDTRIFAKIDIRVKDNSTKIMIEPYTDVDIYNASAESAIKTKISSLIDSYKNFMGSSKTNW